MTPPKTPVAEQGGEHPIDLLIRQRDEALETAHRALTIAERDRATLDKVVRERDEAREALKDILRLLKGYARRDGVNPDDATPDSPIGRARAALKENPDDTRGSND